MMDNCLASSSETGGVGCDNMTMCVVGLLNGKTKEEWYETVGQRVKNGDGPCAPLEFAQFRGPGVHHNFDDSDHSGYEQENGNQRLRGWAGSRDDTDMFDRDDEEKDLDNQVNTSTTEKPKEGTAAATDALPEKLDPGHFTSAVETGDAPIHDRKETEKKE